MFFIGKETKILARCKFFMFLIFNFGQTGSPWLAKPTYARRPLNKQGKQLFDAAINLVS
uniref:Uncharacterized protein n=1 Tax=Oryza punctata TaxID=4537 RepID=A0A0E0K1E7_ORYPU